MSRDRKTKDLLDDLDSNNLDDVVNIKAQLKDVFDKTKDAWVMVGLYDRYMISGSIRVADVIASVKEPHCNHFFEKLLDGLSNRKEKDGKLKHLTLLGHVVRRRPLWLYKISDHGVFKELISLLQTDADIVNVVSALLVINILLLFIPANMVKHLESIFAIFSKLAAMNATSKNYVDAELVHLQISLYTLFHRLYGTFPCNFIAFLQSEFRTPDKINVFSHTVKPMLDTVRVNPLLITASAGWEKDESRWKKYEPHNMIINCAKLLTSNCDTNPFLQTDYKRSLDYQCLSETLRARGTSTVADYCRAIVKKEEKLTLWSPSTNPESVAHRVETTPTAIPLTPITRVFEAGSPFSEHGGSSPPEAAIEATPETTLSKDYIDIPHPLQPIEAPRIRSYMGRKVSISDRSANSLTKIIPPSFDISSKDVLPSQLSMFPQKCNKFHLLKNDRDRVTEEEETKWKPFGKRNDLRDNCVHDNRSGLISAPKKSESSFYSMHSASVNVQSSMDKTQTNGTAVSVASERNNGFSPDVLDNTEECDLDKTGFPCDAGGLHMPQSLPIFTGQIITQFAPTIGGCSTGTSPQEFFSYLNDNLVRRTNSCPEMKKISPSSLFNSSQSTSLLEENENGSEERISNGLDEEMFEKPELVSTYAQTVEPPYIHLFKEMFPPLIANEQYSSTEILNPCNEEVGGGTNSSIPRTVYDKAPVPSCVLQEYVNAAVYCHSAKTSLGNPSNELAYLRQQLKLMGSQLQFEEYRREIHAEGNRRMLGRTRIDKRIEKNYNTLREHVDELQKIVEAKSVDVEKTCQMKDDERKKEEEAASYWKNSYYELEIEYKKICDKFSEVDCLLTEAMKANAVNAKLIQEEKAALGNITNELKVIQREAKCAAGLRKRVSSLQTEVMKAGEILVRYQRRLLDIKRSSPENAKYELLRSTYVAEIERLHTDLLVKSRSLEAAISTINILKNEIKEQERLSQTMFDSIAEGSQKVQKDYEDLQREYKKLCDKHEMDVQKVHGMEARVTTAKLLHKQTGTSHVSSPDTIISKLTLALTKPVDSGKLVRSHQLAKSEEKDNEHGCSIAIAHQSSSESNLSGGYVGPRRKTGERGGQFRYIDPGEPSSSQKNIIE